MADEERFPEGRVQQHSSPPWTQAQVDALNDYQRKGTFHPFTCPNRTDGQHQRRAERGGDLGALLATPSGWICSDCTYTQHWAHDFMFNPPPGPLDLQTWTEPREGELVLQLLPCEQCGNATAVKYGDPAPTKCEEHSG